MKLSSLTIFFPFYNDEGTVIDLINKAYLVGNKISDDLEVIAIHGGNSKDDTYSKILEAKKIHPNLLVIDKRDNKEGYAVIKHGFKNATKDWVFYTDGDAQYNVEELLNLVKKLSETNADCINGYKTNRGDGIIRHVLGDLYARLSTFIFELPVRDTDCDFRLIKREYIEKFELVSTDSSILGELIKKLEISGAKFAEVPVSHFDRVYGKSNYTPLSLFWEKLSGDFKLYFKLKNIKNIESKLRIVKFGIVGAVSILIQFSLFNLFIIYSKIPPFVSTIIADQFAIVNSFLLNNRFTFKDKKHRGVTSKIKPFFKFYMIVSITTLIQSAIVFISNRLFGDTLIISNLAFMFGIFISFFINYFLQKRIVWN